MVSQFVALAFVQDLHQISHILNAPLLLSCSFPCPLLLRISSSHYPKQKFFPQLQKSWFFYLKPFLAFQAQVLHHPQQQQDFLLYFHKMWCSSESYKTSYDLQKLHLPNSCFQAMLLLLVSVVKWLYDAPSELGCSD